MCRARPIYATPERMQALAEGVESILRLPRDPAKVRSDAAEMRIEMARHKPPSGPLDIKLGKGGLVDLEFAVHTLQLIHGAGLDPRLEYAIGGLASAGLIDLSFDADLRLLSRMLVVMRLVAPGSNEPPERSQPLVASLCGHPNWDALLEAHAAARHRIAELWRHVREG
jgi:[glutamine synthetase] adenylyltransferase / [glutamine synthetase]-adenylyl-L-tyrosine phosphorylase